MDSVFSISVFGCEINTKHNKTHKINEMSKNASCVLLDFTVKRRKNTDIIGNVNRCWDIAQKYVIMKYGHDPAGMRMNGAACADMGRNAK